MSVDKLATNVRIEDLKEGDHAISMKEAAEILGVTSANVRTHILAGRLPVVSIRAYLGGVMRYRLSYQTVLITKLDLDRVSHHE